MPTIHPTAQTLRENLPRSEWAAFSAWFTTFLPYQLEWILDASRLAMYLKARQIGISHATAGAVVLWGAALGETTTVISLGQREANEVLDKAHRHAQALVALGSNWARCTRKGDEINFGNGGRIIAVPSSSGGRSFSGNVFIDEYAYLGTKAAMVWDGAAAVTARGYRLRVVSTPNGIGNAFHNLWTNPEACKGWNQYTCTLQRAIAEGCDISADDMWKIANGDPRLFAQLFECSFLDGTQQYIPTELIHAAISDADDAWAEGVAFAGFDVGITNDLSCIVVLTQTENARVTVRSIWTGKRTDWQEQQRIVGETIQKWGVRRLCVDATGLGHGMAQALQQRFGRQRIEPVVFTQQSKEKLATDLYQAFADSMIIIPRDEALMKDISAIRRIVTAAGAIRYDAAHTAEGHADRAWALALAIAACSTTPSRVTQLTGGDFSA